MSICKIHKFSGITSNNATSIETYAENLIYLLRLYLEAYNEDMDKLYDEVTNKEAKSYLIYKTFKESKSFYKDYEKFLRNGDKNIDYKTFNLVKGYLKCCMQIIGKLFEALLIDRAYTNDAFNKYLLNISLLKEDFYKNYEDIDYNNYIPIPTSFKNIYTKDTKGKIKRTSNFYYNPRHNRIDIEFVNINNVQNTLVVEIPKYNYTNIAHLQLKASSSPVIRVNPFYKLTPIIGFCPYNDIRMREDYMIYSIKNIDKNLYNELEKYFEIILCYLCEYTDRLNVTELSVLNRSKIFEQILHVSLDNSLQPETRIDIAKILRKNIKKINKKFNIVPEVVID